MIYLLGIMLIQLLINNLLFVNEDLSYRAFYTKINQNKSWFIDNLRQKSFGRKEISLLLSVITLYIVLGLGLKFNSNSLEYQERIEILGFTFGLDGIGLALIGLITLLDPILIILLKGENEEEIERKRIINQLIFIKILIILLFASLDILVFFITFELILVPMFILITRYGSKYKYFIPRLEAGVRFFMFTMLGSILMFLGIIIFYIKYGTTSNELLTFKINSALWQSLEILNNIFTTRLEKPINSIFVQECILTLNNNILLLQFIWVFFFFSFLIKIPMFPFHTWLPLAHSDAPTIGSIILAALLLKLASFGILRYSLYLFQPITQFDLGGTLAISDLIYDCSIYKIFLPVIYILALISIIYCSLIPLRGLFDLKKIIAYSSIIHMNFSIFGFFAMNIIGLIGASLLMFTHAFISSALFLLIGILYKRYHTRFLPYYQGLSISMPIFSFFFLFFSFANISLPFCSSFLSEFFILVSSFHFNPFISFLLALSLIISSSFVIWFANKLLFGTISSYINSSKAANGLRIYLGSKDITLIEFLTLLPFFFFTFIITFFPQPLISLFSLPLLFFL